MTENAFPDQCSAATLPWGVWSRTATTPPRKEGSYSTALGVWTHPIDPELAYTVTFNERVFTYAEFLCMVRSMQTIKRRHYKRHPGFT